METNTVEYTAQTASPLIKGETKLKITEKSLILAGLFDVAEIPFAEINSISLADYVVIVNADGGNFVFSRLGNWCQPFFDSLLRAYNAAVLRSLFVKIDPIVTAKGGYSYSEAGESAEGDAPVYVYENSVVMLPPDLSARRVPLCFADGLDKGEFELTIRLDSGENYTLTKLGYETGVFEKAVENQIRALREKTLSAVKEIDPSLQMTQASQLAKLVPQGAAASIGQFAGIAPSFVSALEEKIDGTRAKDYYKVFKEMCDPEKIYVGFRKNEAADDSGEDAEGVEEMPAEFSEGVSDQISDTEAVAEEPPEPFLIWMIAPSPDGQFVAIEFAEKDAATFVYRTGGDAESFAMKLNRALEAIDFKREVIRLSDKELLKPENADYYMASKRTAALRFIRDSFVGRVIHSSPEAWRKKLKELWGVL